MNDTWFEKFNNVDTFLDLDNIRDTFKYFDRDNDEELNLLEFVELFNSLFHHRTQFDRLSKEKFLQFYHFYTGPNKSSLNFRDFELFWVKTVKPSLFAHSALIIVDMQNDFFEGPLALKDFEANEDPLDAIPNINKMISQIKFDLIVYTQDWHPNNHISFYENRYLRKFDEFSKVSRNLQIYDEVTFENDIKQTLMPSHCVQYTYGARLHSKLKIVENKYRAMILRKGTYSDVDSYSAFYDKNNESNKKITSLDYELKKRGITDLYVCGLSTDGCVAATVFDGCNLNYRVVLVEDACKGANIVKIETLKRKMLNKGAIIVNSDEVKDMVHCVERKPLLGYATIKDNSLTSFYE